jgi:hypothetical protein
VCEAWRHAFDLQVLAHEIAKGGRSEGAGTTRAGQARAPLI